MYFKSIVIKRLFVFYCKKFDYIATTSKYTVVIVSDILNTGLCWNFVINKLHI